eukprot:5680317-Pleurochrysis_carterae.AAC.6
MRWRVCIDVGDRGAHPKVEPRWFARPSRSITYCWKWSRSVCSTWIRRDTRGTRLSRRRQHAAASHQPPLTFTALTFLPPPTPLQASRRSSPHGPSLRASSPPAWKPLNAARERTRVLPTPVRPPMTQSLGPGSERAASTSSRGKPPATQKKTHSRHRARSGLAAAHLALAMRSVAVTAQKLPHPCCVGRATKPEHCLPSSPRAARQRAIGRCSCTNTENEQSGGGAGTWVLARTKCSLAPLRA